MIPPFTADGVLPPFLGPDPAGPAAAMAPFLTDAVELVRRFGATAERREILDGLLRYRAALSAVGLSDGFQWLDGSFVEDKPPGDIDIVTFFHWPAAVTSVADAQAFVQQHGALFDRDQAKLAYRCDAFFIELDTVPEDIVALTRYWFGLFTHQRVTFVWKGILQVPLHTPQEDAAAARLLNPPAAAAGGP